MPKTEAEMARIAELTKGEILKTENQYIQHLEDFLAVEPFIVEHAQGNEGVVFKNAFEKIKEIIEIQKEFRQAALNNDTDKQIEIIGRMVGIYSEYFKSYRKIIAFYDEPKAVIVKKIINEQLKMSEQLKTDPENSDLIKSKDNLSRLHMNALEPTFRLTRYHSLYEDLVSRLPENSTEREKYDLVLKAARTASSDANNAVRAQRAADEQAQARALQMFNNAITAFNACHKNDVSERFEEILKIVKNNRLTPKDFDGMFSVLKFKKIEKNLAEAMVKKAELPDHIRNNFLININKASSQAYLNKPAPEDKLHFIQKLFPHCEIKKTVRFGQKSLYRVFDENNQPLCKIIFNKNKFLIKVKPGYKTENQLKMIGEARKSPSDTARRLLAPSFKLATKKMGEPKVPEDILPNKPAPRRS